MTFTEPMFDPELRFRAMDEVGVAVQLLSYTWARINKPLSEYLRGLYYDTVCYDDEALLLAYKLAGPRRLLYGSDYPHNIGDMAGCADRITALPIDETEKELIRSGNARRLFKL